ncbi:MAG: hypothetical protein DWQ37_03575 [Planctomycetota bacterium]|nr:MAG: hypothetical protein DWQ37_03575 [Planctomycetota bacterium]
MDRKATGTCAAVLASLGVMMIAGCGSDAVGTTPTARTERPASPSKPEAVVVSVVDVDASRESPPPLDESNPNPTAMASDSVAETASGWDPYAEPDSEEVVALEATEVASEPADRYAADYPLAGEPTPAQGSDEMPEADSEVKFAVPGTHPLAVDVPREYASSTEPQRQTIRLDVRPDSTSSELVEQTPIEQSPGEPQAGEPAVAASRPSRQAPAEAVAEETKPEVQSSTQPVAMKPVTIKAVPIEPRPVEPAPAEPQVAQQESAEAPAPGNEPAQKPAAPRRALSPLVIRPRVAPAAVAASQPAEPELSEPGSPAEAAAEPQTADVAQAPETQEPVLQQEPPADIELTPRAQVPQLAAKAAQAPQPPAAQAPQPQSAPAARADVAQSTPHAVPIPTPIQLAAPQPAAPQTVAAPAPRHPLPQVTPLRSPALVAAIARADERVRHAIQLAEKGALFAARKEFIAAINQIAQAHDVDQRTRKHINAAIAGFRALKEANQFVGVGLTEVNVSALVEGHKTPALKGVDTADMPGSLAAQYYFDYAKTQLATSVGRETVGSIALYGLGKIIISGAGRNSQQLEYSGPAMALFQAAVISEPQNFRAAHELGVLLAGSGQLEMARQMLMGSAAASPQPVIWKNLSVVHSRLGEVALAQQARQNAEVLEAANPKSDAPPVHWVDPATFASTSKPSEAGVPSAAMPAAARPSASPAAPKTALQPENEAKGSSDQRSSSRWNPLNLRR